MKSFGTHSYNLCIKERVEILLRSKNDPNSLINTNTEIYGAWYTKIGSQVEVSTVKKNVSMNSQLSSLKICHDPMA